MLVEQLGTINSVERKRAYLHDGYNVSSVVIRSAFLCTYYYFVIHAKLECFCNTHIYAHTQA